MTSWDKVKRDSVRRLTERPWWVEHKPSVHASWRAIDGMCYPTEDKAVDAVLEMGVQPNNDVIRVVYRGAAL